MMYSSLVLSAFFALASAQSYNSTYLTTTALSTNAQNHSALECWQFSTPVVVSTDKGTVGATTYSFPDAYESLYTVIPPRANRGVHNAPVAQLVVFLSGLIHVTLPVPATGNRSLNEAYLVGGANGVLFAADTMGTGHITTYPGDQPTVTLQIRCKDGKVPEHEALHEGPCHYQGDAGQTSKYLIGS